MDNILEPPPALTQSESRGWRSFFSGRAVTSMRGSEEASGWWQARGHAYALGWSSTLNSADPPAAIRTVLGQPYEAWIDGRQRHQALTVQADVLRSAVR